MFYVNMCNTTIKTMCFHIIQQENKHIRGYLNKAIVVTKIPETTRPT